MFDKNMFLEGEDHSHNLSNKETLFLTKTSKSVLWNLQ